MDHLEVKKRTRELWAQGDWASMARHLESAARALVEECAVEPGDRVLDVAAGTGNVAVWAARAGATVVATDLCPALVVHGRRRCRAEGLPVEWREADMENLPFDDACFDAVLCAFGLSFAPRREIALSEMLRVLKPGGSVGLVNWAGDGWPARSAAILARYLGAPEMSGPISPGDGRGAGRRRAEPAGPAKVARRFMWYQFPSLEAWWEHWHRCAPHMALARSALSQSEYDALRDDLIASVRAVDVGGGSVTRWRCEYVIAVTTKASSPETEVRSSGGGRSDVRPHPRETRGPGPSLPRAREPC